MLRKEQTETQEGRPLAQGNRVNWNQSPDWNPSFLTLSAALHLWPATPVPPTTTCSQFAPLSILLGSRAQPQFLLSGKCTKSAYFLLSSHLFSRYTLSSSAMKKNQGFLEDTQSWLRTHPASFSNYLSSIWASNAWPASQSPLSRSFGLLSAIPFHLLKSLWRCERRER